MKYLIKYSVVYRKYQQRIIKTNKITIVDNLSTGLKNIYQE